MRLPPPLIAAIGSLALALAAAVVFAATGPLSVQAQAPGAQVVDVTMDEWSINPRHIVVKANQPVRFVVTGTGLEDHRFNVIGMGMERLRSDRVLPAGTITLDATFTTPGTYQVWCSTGDNPSHKDAGMVGTLTVVPESADPVLEVPVQAGDHFFAPMSLTAVAGQTTRFMLEDVGEESHRLTIVGHGVELNSPTVRPGQPITWDVTFTTPGTYEINCPFTTAEVPHKDMGMVGTIEVFRGGAGM